MKNKKIITLIATLGLITCMYTKVNAVKFYDTMGTRYEGSVERLGELGIIQGISDKTFAPEKTVTRAEFAKMIVEMSLNTKEIWALNIDDSKCNFTDVSKDKWYYKYVVVAVNYGYINGYEDNTFRPDEKVTYEQASKMFMKALGHNYLVETDPRGWSAEYMDKMYSLNIADGTTEFKKTDAATRGNIATMLWNTFVSNVWEKIELNDTNGFTYIDSGKTLFDRKIRGYVYKDDFKVNGFKEINGKLHVKIDDLYYQFYDQNATVLFTMLGGDAESLFKLVRYPQNVYRYEVVGLSADVGSQLYSGTIQELKAEGNPVKAPITRVGSDADYAYVIKAEKEENNRAITLNSQGEVIFVKEISISKESEAVEKDDKEVIEEIQKSENEYEYRNSDENLNKTITINKEYVIADGAVLFENNKRVDWSTVKAGAVITEIKKDEYYFLSRDSIETTISSYKKTDDGIEFGTPNGIIKIFNRAQCVEYYSEDDEYIMVKNLKKEDLDSLIGIKVAFDLDFSGRAVRMEIIENNMAKPEEEKQEKHISGMKELNIGYFVEYTQSGTDNFYISLFFDDREKVMRTTLKSINVNPGDLVQLELDDKNVITKMSKLSDNANISEKFKLKSITASEISKYIKDKKITEKTPMNAIKYFYDFGEYDKVTGFEVNKVTIEDIDNFNSEKTKYLVVTDTNNNVRAVLFKDYSNKKEVFYGKVNRIYSEDSSMKIIISIFEHKELTFNTVGLINCEEGDVVSFKFEGKSAIRILEKYPIDVLGFHKDIKVNDITYKGIDAENGEIYLKEGKIVSNKKEYKISEFDIILLKLKKADNNWSFAKGDILEVKDLKLEINDRIAINEIEDTIIIYRGYKE